MCKRTVPTDSTEFFHMFLAEVGVEVVYPCTCPTARSVMTSRRPGQAFYPYFFVMRGPTRGAVQQWLPELPQKQELFVKALQSENAGCAIKQVRA
jgi:hypothetical protein